MKHLNIKDLKVGETIYVAHPEYGIDVIIVKSKPVKSELSGSLFIKTTQVIDDFTFDSVYFINDAGISDHSYNYRRTFGDLSDAENYIKQTKNNPDFIEHQKTHEFFCSDYDDIMDYEWITKFLTVKLEICLAL